MLDQQGIAQQAIDILILDIMVGQAALTGFKIAFTGDAADFLNRVTENRAPNIVVKNSSGFGGANVALVFKRAGQ